MQKYKTNWDLSLLYKNENDPEIEKYLKKYESAYGKLEKRYKGKDFTSSASKLLEALKYREELFSDLDGNVPHWYFALRTDLNSDDSVAGALATKIEQRITKAAGRITFFHLAICNTPKAKQKVYLKDKNLAPFRYGLEKAFKAGQYMLTEKEEQLEDLLSQTSYTMWIDGQERVLNKETINFKGEKVPISKAVYIISDQSKEDRDHLNNEINKVLFKISDFAEAEINAIYNYKKIMDERRGYKRPQSATILGCENDEKSIDNLVGLVTKNFKISQRFYKLHAKLLKQKALSVGDRAVPMGEIKKKFDFETSTEVLNRAFAKVDSKYPEILKGFLENGQIDVYPRKGKRGGAYCWGMGLRPTFVLLNHTDNVGSVEIFAHEMGHAFHTELSKQQPARYRKYSTATAEVASTFFEQLVSSELENELSKEERTILLHNKIMGDMSTIFRQIAFYNFELELHERIREEGQVSKDKIAKLFSKHLKSYMGDVFNITDEDGYFFVKLSHMRRFFYVYSYAYGQIISRALFERWKEDPTYSKKIEQFLRAGKSASPEAIFNSIGIDTSKPEFFLAGLKGIEGDIKKLEKLTAN